VPCHRIIASNLYIGGFSGEWDTGANARGGQKNTGLQCNRKMEMLAKERVTFSVNGYLADVKSLLWIGRGCRVWRHSEDYTTIDVFYKFIDIRLSRCSLVKEVLRYWHDMLVVY
jgi:hypothetical protein